MKELSIMGICKYCLHRRVSFRRRVYTCRLSNEETTHLESCENFEDSRPITQLHWNWTEGHIWDVGMQTDKIFAKKKDKQMSKKYLKDKNKNKEK